MNELVKNKKKSEILAESIAELDYGVAITHKQIQKIIGETYGTTRYNTTIQKMKKILLKKYGKKLESIRGDGYRVINPGDYVQASLKHYKRGFKEMQKGQDTLAHAPTDKMNKEELEVFRRVNDRALALNAHIKGVRVELKELSENKRKLVVNTN